MCHAMSTFMCHATSSNLTPRDDVSCHINIHMSCHVSIHMSCHVNIFHVIPKVVDGQVNQIGEVFSTINGDHRWLGID
jgi:hypothetical protein